MMVAEHVAVIGAEQDERVVELSQPLQHVDHAADLFVDEAHRSVVSLAAVVDDFGGQVSRGPTPVNGCR